MNAWQILQIEHNLGAPSMSGIHRGMNPADSSRTQRLPSAEYVVPPRPLTVTARAGDHKTRAARLRG